MSFLWARDAVDPRCIPLPTFSVFELGLFVLEIYSSIKLFRICFVAAFVLAVDFWASRRDVAVRNVEVGMMPGKLWPKRRAVVGLNFLNGKGEMVPDSPEAIDGGLVFG